MDPRGRRPGGLCLWVRGKGSGGGIRGGVRARPGAQGGGGSGTLGPGPGLREAQSRGARAAAWGAHLTRNCSFHTFPLLWHSSRSRRQVLETRLMSAAVSEPLHRMYSSTSPGRLTRQQRPAASGAASSASAGTTSIALSTAAVAILSAYLGRLRARAGETPLRPAHLARGAGAPVAPPPPITAAAGCAPCGGNRWAACLGASRHPQFAASYVPGASRAHVSSSNLPNDPMNCVCLLPEVQMGTPRFRERQQTCSEPLVLDSDPDLLGFARSQQAMSLSGCCAELFHARSPRAALR